MTYLFKEQLSGRYWDTTCIYLMGNTIYSKTNYSEHKLYSLTQIIRV